MEVSMETAVFNGTLATPPKELTPLNLCAKHPRLTFWLNKEEADKLAFKINCCLQEIERRGGK